jgi:hypothetical protein
VNDVTIHKNYVTQLSANVPIFAETNLKKMKTKNILLSSLLILSLTAAKSQGLYAGFGVGYGMPVCGSVLGYISTDNNPGNTFSTENVKGSYGKGINFGGYIGFMPNENIGFELGVNYLMGSKYKFTSNDINGNSSDISSDEAKVNSLRLNPAVRIGFGTGKFRPYMRAGITIGVMTKMTDEYSRTHSDPGETDITIETFEYTGGTYAGFTGALGMTFGLSDKMSLFGELTNYYISWGATKGAITKSTYNGSDQLGMMTTDQKQFEFVTKIDQTMNTSSSQPSKQLINYSPLSSFGINVGLHFAFGG